MPKKMNPVRHYLHDESKGNKSGGGEGDSQVGSLVFVKMGTRIVRAIANPPLLVVIKSRLTNNSSGQIRPERMTTVVDVLTAIFNLRKTQSHQGAYSGFDSARQTDAPQENDRQY